MLQVRLEKLAEHVEGAVHRELLERVERPLVQLRVCELAGFVDVVQLAGDLAWGTEKNDGRLTNGLSENWRVLIRAGVSAIRKLTTVNSAYRYSLKRDSRF